MATLINLSGLQNATTVVDVVNYANSVTSNLVGGFFILSIFFIILVNLLRKGEDFADSMAVASFVGFIISAIARYLGFVSLYMVVAFLTLLAISLLFIKTRREAG